jgi:hypothetical protein
MSLKKKLPRKEYDDSIHSSYEYGARDQKPHRLEGIFLHQQNPAGFAVERTSSIAF